MTLLTETFQELIFNLAGFKKVERDPWGNQQTYLSWLYSLDPNNPEQYKNAFLVHACTCGAQYLALSYYIALQISTDFSKLNGESLLYIVIKGSLIEDFIFNQLMTDKDREKCWRIDFTRYLPYNYLIDLLGDSEQLPLEHLITHIKMIIFERLAVEEMQRRKANHPEIELLERCLIAEYPYLQQYSKFYFPDRPIPNRHHAIKELSDWAGNNVWNIYGLDRVNTSDYARSSIYNVFVKPISKKVAKLNKEQKESYLNKIDYGNSLFHLRLLKRFAIAYDKKMAGYLHTAIKNDLISEHRIFGGTKGVSENDTPFFKELAIAPEAVEELGLADFDLPLDKLTKREKWVLQDVIAATYEGYTLSSKLGMSLTTRWGVDYTRNIKTRSRLKHKLKANREKSIE